MPLRIDTVHLFVRPSVAKMRTHELCELHSVVKVLMRYFTFY